MKKALIGILAIVFIFAATTLIVQFSPKPISKSYTGVKYQLGPENADNTEQIPIVIEGILKKNLFDRNYYLTFKGTMKIGDVTLPLNTDPFFTHDDVEIKFSRSDGSGYIPFMDIDNRIEEDLRFMHISGEFEELTIIISKKHESGKGSGWSSRDGLMISAPASNREEAVQISNRLMRDFLQSGETLE